MPVAVCSHPKIYRKGSKMPKMKTRSSVKKRFSVTGTGKLKRNFAKKRHCLFCKTQKMKRQARGTTLVDTSDVQIVKQFLPYL
jgi:large subunit ribosomal protein L35